LHLIGSITSKTSQFAEEEKVQLPPAKKMAVPTFMLEP